MISPHDGNLAVARISLPAEKVHLLEQLLLMMLQLSHPAVFWLIVNPFPLERGSLCRKNVQAQNLQGPRRGRKSIDEMICIAFETYEMGVYCLQRIVYSLCRDNARVFE
jgi:hypothetical protein